MSNLDIFKVGVGPSSSHTLGPMIAAATFLKLLDLEKTEKIMITLYGSLSLTGKGHLSDLAVLWGLSGQNPDNISSKAQEEIKKLVFKHNKLNLDAKKEIAFNYEKDLYFSKVFLKYHQNALKIEALDKNGRLLKSEIYYSIGGGFIKIHSLLNTEDKDQKKEAIKPALELNSAAELIAKSHEYKLSLSELSLKYELQFNNEKYIKNYCLRIWEVMQAAYKRGINPKDPSLPGSLKLHRRAKGLKERLVDNDDPLGVLDFISLYAISIAEENAAGAQVVTAPTNGACAVIPAVMLYLKHSEDFSDDRAYSFLLAAMLIGSLYRKNASISGAEAGCQAEIGAASSMAAAAMADVKGASADIACNAAEAAMEHHLGLTCDPVDGLVQIPCIERNAFGAIKAVLAARMCMGRKSTPVISLDEVIKAMYETGKDMDQKYKETSLGGLASVC